MEEGSVEEDVGRGSGSAAGRVRREPPRFRQVTVAAVERRSPRLVRVTLTGPELDGLAVEQPAASVRLLLPHPATDGMVVPEWDGNQFLLPDGSRPTIRTFTPRRLDSGPPALDLEIVVHGDGAASDWAARAAPGDRAAVSGTGRGYRIDPEAEQFVLAGDETAIPAIAQLLEALPAGPVVQVLVELAAPEARLELPDRPGSSVEWLDLPAGAPPGAALAAAVGEEAVATGTRLWVAGEAAAVQQIRRRLFQERGLDRSQATVRGYWKHGRAGDSGDGSD